MASLETHFLLFQKVDTIFRPGGCNMYWLDGCLVACLCFCRICGCAFAPIWVALLHWSWAFALAGFAFAEVVLLHWSWLCTPGTAWQAAGWQWCLRAVVLVRRTWRGQALVPLVGGGPALVLRLGLDRPLVLHNLGGGSDSLGRIFDRTRGQCLGNRFSLSSDKYWSAIKKYCKSGF